MHETSYKLRKHHKMDGPTPRLANYTPAPPLHACLGVTRAFSVRTRVSGTVAVPVNVMSKQATLLGNKFSVWERKDA